MFLHQRFKKANGFTLVEVILAVALLSLVLTMVAGLVITGIRVNTANVHELQATYIAEEGLEIVRNIRDNNWWQNVDFSDGLVDGTYRVSLSDNAVPWTLTAINSNKTDTDSYLYTDTISDVPVMTDDATAGTLSGFRRFITIDTVSEGIIDVSSTVQWNERGIKKEIILSTSLTDWKGGPL